MLFVLVYEIMGFVFVKYLFIKFDELYGFDKFNEFMFEEDIEN